MNNRTLSQNYFTGYKCWLGPHNNGLLSVHVLRYRTIEGRRSFVYIGSFDVFLTNNSLLMEKARSLAMCALLQVLWFANTQFLFAWKRKEMLFVSVIAFPAWVVATLLGVLKSEFIQQKDFLDFLILNKLWKKVRRTTCL